MNIGWSKKDILTVSIFAIALFFIESLLLYKKGVLDQEKAFETFIITIVKVEFAYCLLLLFSFLKNRKSNGDK